MKQNMSDTDRTLRLTGAGVLAMLDLSGIINLPESILVWVVVTALAITALSGKCPMYKLFGINTKHKRRYNNKHN